jgi:phosphoglycerate kinase
MLIGGVLLDRLKIMMKLPIIDETVAGKRVLVRGDIDAPLVAVSGERLAVSDDTRLRAISPTIEFLLKNNCKVTLCGHIGRPASADATARQAFFVKPIAEWFAKMVNDQYPMINEGNKFRIGENLVVLENLRFDPREEANDSTFAEELARDQDIFVNEAFATCERAHTSIVGVPKLLPHFAGFRLAKEIEVLSQVLENPQHPLVVFIGGIKWETKEVFAAKMKTVADLVVSSKEMPPGLDVKIEEIDKYKDQIAKAKTIVWNGPFGKIEDFTYQVGTKRLAELITASPAYKIVGGGDTVAFVNKLGLTDKFDWVSTGGGSMLKLLAGEELPGVTALVAC